MYTPRPLTNDYRTTATDYQLSSTVNSYPAPPQHYDSRLGLGEMDHHPVYGYKGVDTDGGRMPPELDSGRDHRRVRSKISNSSSSSAASEFVLNGNVRRSEGVGPLPPHNLHHHTKLRQSQSSHSYMLPSSYRTHSDQRHPRQEMIAPNVLISSRQHLPHQIHHRNYHDEPPLPTAHQLYERSTPAPHPTATTQSSSNNVVRPVSPQMKRRSSNTSINSSSSSTGDLSLVDTYYTVLDTPTSISSPPPLYAGRKDKEYYQTSYQQQSVATVAEPVLVPPSCTSSNNTSRKSNSTVKTRIKFQRLVLDMSVHSNRVDTFINHQPCWSGALSHMLLVKSGFFYTGQEDIVKCFSCQALLGNWKYNDNVEGRHFLASPNCAYLRKEYLAKIISDICPDMFRFHSDFGNRFKSFNFWPIPSQVKGRKLAEAGFFYANKGIRTQCYSCGIVKDDWKTGDEPFMIHVEMSPKCPHMMENMFKYKPLAAATAGLSGETEGKEYKVLYRTEEDRLKSFKNYDSLYASHGSTVPVRKEDLARAGFVLIRPPCTVQCTECDIVVEDWQIGDDPILKHMKLNDTCSFITSFLKSQEKKRALLIGASTYSTDPMPVVSSQTTTVTEEYEDEGISEASIQYPPSYKASLSTSSNESISLPSQNSIDKEEMMGSSIFKRSFSVQDDSQLCIVCFENPKECAIIPCGHLCVCKSCADKLDYCPICRRSKRDILKIFIP